MNDLYEIATPAPTPEHPKRRKFMGLYVWPDGGIDFTDELAVEMETKMRRIVEQQLRLPFPDEGSPEK